MKIGLVLGAGGHPGYPFQIAVLRAIERRLGTDLRDADLVLGTSVGAMTGLLLRAGFGPEDLCAIALGQEPTDHGSHLLHEVLDPPGHLPPTLPKWQPPAPSVAAVRGGLRSLRGSDAAVHRVPAAVGGLFPRGRACHAVFGHAAESLLPGGWPDLPTWVVSLRADDGGRTVFGRDAHPLRVGQAITASCAIPGFFRPTEVDGVRHVDAGIRSTTNADLLTEGADVDLAIVVPPLALDGASGRLVDLPLRWLVNAQLRSEVAMLEAAGVRTVVAAPPVHVAKTLQGSPIHMSDDRVAHAVRTTADWADAWAAEHLLATRTVRMAARRPTAAAAVTAAARAAALGVVS